MDCIYLHSSYAAAIRKKVDIMKFFIDKVTRYYLPTHTLYLKHCLFHKSQLLKYSRYFSLSNILE
jgi:hypothetical protein